MKNHEEKLSLLSEMIAFSIVDGRLHKREYDFIAIVASELKISKAAFDDLFHQEYQPLIIKTDYLRIQQFYRLALLMRVDGILHEKEEIAIKQIAINMGLNPVITKRILMMMKVSPSGMIDPNYLLDAFKEQYN